MTALYACLASFAVPFAWGVYLWAKATKAESARAIAVGALTGVEHDRDAYKVAEQVQRDRNVYLEKRFNEVLGENSLLRVRLVGSLKPEEVLPALNEAFGSKT